MGDKMHSRFKTLLLILTVIIVILTVLAGLTFAADSRVKIAATLANLSACIHVGQYLSCIKDIAPIAFVFLLLVWRGLFLRRPQS
jgi:hypothetical protein